MATIKAKTLEGEGERSHRIRITLTSQNVASLEKGERARRASRGGGRLRRECRSYAPSAACQHVEYPSTPRSQCAPT